MFVSFNTINILAHFEKNIIDSSLSLTNFLLKKGMSTSSKSLLGKQFHIVLYITDYDMIACVIEIQFSFKFKYFLCE